MKPPVGIELQVEMVLVREGIVITKALNMPSPGFILDKDSTIGGCIIKHLCAVKALHPDGSRRRDLRSFQLLTRSDAKKLSPGQIVCLERVEFFNASE